MTRRDREIDHTHIEVLGDRLVDGVEEFSEFDGAVFPMALPDDLPRCDVEGHDVRRGVTGVSRTSLPGFCRTPISISFPSCWRLRRR